jgi:hypothetical protein
MSLEIATKELCKLTVKSENVIVALSMVQNISFAICTDSNRRVYQLPGHPAIYGVEGGGSSIGDKACQAISTACTDTCTERRMNAVPFVAPQGKGCLGSCACIQPGDNGVHSGIFYGKDLLKFPLAKTSTFQNEGRKMAPISLFLLGVSFLL